MTSELMAQMVDEITAQILVLNERDVAITEEQARERSRNIVLNIEWGYRVEALHPLPLDPSAAVAHTAPAPPLLRSVPAVARPDERRVVHRVLRALGRPVWCGNAGHDGDCDTVTAVINEGGRTTT